MFRSFDDVVSFNKANVDAFVQSANRLAAGVEEIAKEVFGYTGKTLEVAVQGSKALASCKNPDDMARVQQQLARESWDKAVAQSSKLSEMGAIVARSALEPIQARYKRVTRMPLRPWSERIIPEFSP